MRAWRSAAVLGLLTAGFGIRLIEVDVALGRRLVGILFGYAQHLVELLAEHVVVALVLLDGFLEQILAAALLAFHALHGGFEIGKRGRFFVLFVTDDGAGGRID